MPSEGVEHEEMPIGPPVGDDDIVENLKRLNLDSEHIKLESSVDEQLRKLKNWVEPKCLKSFGLGDDVDGWACGPTGQTNGLPIQIHNVHHAPRNGFAIHQHVWHDQYQRQPFDLQPISRTDIYQNGFLNVQQSRIGTVSSAPDRPLTNTANFGMPNEMPYNHQHTSYGHNLMPSNHHHPGQYQTDPSHQKTPSVPCMTSFVHHQTPLGQYQTGPNNQNTPSIKHQTPPGHYQTPSAHHQTPPGYCQTGPSHQKTPCQTPSVHHQTPPGYCQTGPSHQKTPCQTPSVHHQTPPGHHVNTSSQSSTFSQIDHSVSIINRSDLSTSDLETDGGQPFDHISQVDRQRLKRPIESPWISNSPKAICKPTGATEESMPIEFPQSFPQNQTTPNKSFFQSNSCPPAESLFSILMSGQPLSNPGPFLNQSSVDLSEIVPSLSQSSSSSPVEAVAGDQDQVTSNSPQSSESSEGFEFIDMEDIRSLMRIETQLGVSQNEDSRGISQDLGKRQSQPILIDTTSSSVSHMNSGRSQFVPDILDDDSSSIDRLFSMITASPSSQTESSSSSGPGPNSPLRETEVPVNLQDPQDSAVPVLPAYDSAVKKGDWVMGPVWPSEYHGAATGASPPKLSQTYSAANSQATGASPPKLSQTYLAAKSQAPFLPYEGDLYQFQNDQLHEGSSEICNQWSSNSKHPDQSCPGQSQSPVPGSQERSPPAAMNNLNINSPHAVDCVSPNIAPERQAPAGCAAMNDDYDPEDSSPCTSSDSTTSSIIAESKVSKDTCLHLVSYMTAEEMRQIVNENREACQRLVDVKNGRQQTPLFLAVARNSHHSVRMLLFDLKANPDIQGKDNNSLKMQGPLHKAIEMGKKYLVEMFLDCETINIELQRYFDQKTPLMLALDIHRAGLPERDRSDIIQLLVLHGADVFKFDEASDHTILMSAIETRDLRVVAFILEYVGCGHTNALINQQNKSLNTALHIAAGLAFEDKDKHVKLLRMLIEYGGNRDALNRDNRTPKDWNKSLFDKVNRQMMI